MQDLYRLRAEYQELRSKLEIVDKGLSETYEGLKITDTAVKNNYTINNTTAAGSSIVKYINEVVDTINYIRTKVIPAIDVEIQNINNKITQGN